MSVRRSAASFGIATALGHASQLLWLAIGIRVMSGVDFGTVLAAQALYGVLQIVIDIGTNVVGARMVAQGELDDERRGQIVRMRLLLALAMTPVALVLGALNVSGSLPATLPFVLALVLFAVLNVWEPYGGGDARPWATYMFARSGVLAVAACGFYVLGGSFPLPLAGALECVAIVAVMAVFGRRPLAAVRVAMRVRGGPWRSVFEVVGPAFTTQTSTAAGTLVLSGAGRPAAAGIFAACVRLLTGVNAIQGIVATSLYPRLAHGRGQDPEGERHVVTIALTVIAVLGAGATAVCALFGSLIARAFLGQTSHAIVAALVLSMAAAVPIGNIAMFSYQMLARGFERATVLPFALGGPLPVVFAIVAVAIAGARVDLVAASLLGGQIVMSGGLGLRVRTTCPDVAAPAGRAIAVSLVIGALACAALVHGGALPAGLALLVLTAALLWRLRAFIASVLARLRSRRGTLVVASDETGGGESTL